MKKRLFQTSIIFALSVIPALAMSGDKVTGEVSDLLLTILLITLILAVGPILLLLLGVVGLVGVGVVMRWFGKKGGRS